MLVRSIAVCSNCHGSNLSAFDLKGGIIVNPAKFYCADCEKVVIVDWKDVNI